MTRVVIHLIYNSAAVKDFSDEELRQLLLRARRNNAARDITGILLFVDGCFFQILEGPEAAVDDLAERIGRDPRHTNMTVIIREPIARRAFGQWTMGFGQVDAGDIGRLDGLNDFFAGQQVLADVDAGRAKKLLEAFSRGRWRVRLAAQPPGMAPLTEEPAAPSIDPRPMTYTSG